MSFLYSISAADRKGLARETPCQSVGFLCLFCELFIWQSQTFPLFWENYLWPRSSESQEALSEPGKLFIPVYTSLTYSCSAWQITRGTSPCGPARTSLPLCLSWAECSTAFTAALSGLPPSVVSTATDLLSLSLTRVSITASPSTPSEPAYPSMRLSGTEIYPLYFSHSKIMQRSCSLKSKIMQFIVIVLKLYFTERVWRRE